MSDMTEPPAAARGDHSAPVPAGIPPSAADAGPGLRPESHLASYQAPSQGAGLVEERIDLEWAEEHEERLRLALELATLGEWEWCHRTKRIRLSQLCCSALGMKEQENLTLASLTSMIHPADQEDVWKTIGTVLSTRAETAFNLECRLLIPKGELIWIAAKGKPFFACRGDRRRLTRIIGTVMDITEQKQREKALRDSEMRLRLTTEAANIGTWYTDIGKNEHYADAKCKQLFGLSEDTLLSDDLFWRCIHPEDHSLVREAIESSIENRCGYDCEYRTIWPDGSLHWMLGKGSICMNDQGKPDLMHGAVFDITDRKLAEEDMRRTAEELERSNKDLQQFAYVASHDLQEPLRAISIHLQFIKRHFKGSIDPHVNEDITNAVESAARMSNMINDLLEYSRVGTKGKRPKHTDSEDVLTRVLTGLKARIEQVSASVTYGKMPVVFVDETQLGQLLQNLISNALKFHSDRSPEIHVSVKSKSHEWVFAVRDNGIGIDQRHFEKIFTIFQRLHGQGKHPGTGIGLALCKKIIERHGGRIWLESEVGKGTTFFFTLPKAASPAKQENPALLTL